MIPKSMIESGFLKFCVWDQNPSITYALHKISQLFFKNKTYIVKILAKPSVQLSA